MLLFSGLINIHHHSGDRFSMNLEQLLTDANSTKVESRQTTQRLTSCDTSEQRNIKTHLHRQHIKELSLENIMNAEMQQPTYIQ